MKTSFRKGVEKYASEIGLVEDDREKFVDDVMKKAAYDLERLRDLKVNPRDLILLSQLNPDIDIDEEALGTEGLFRRLLTVQ